MRTLPTFWLPDSPRRTGTFVNHCSGGEHGTDPEEMRAFVAAFSDPSIWMEGNELHSNRVPFDLSEFWQEWKNREP